MAKIFISHKKEDSYYATKISDHLRRKGIGYYLDILDPELISNGPELTQHLRNNLNNCSHLLALLSRSTQNSWWVPFEIGLATERNYPISSYLLPSATTPIPDYLWNWPVLRSEDELDKYSSTVLKDKQTLLYESIQKGLYSTSKSQADLFHENLKNQLNQ